MDVANEIRRLLALPGTDPALDVDTGLRPEGKQGPLVRTLDSYDAYYARWSAVWEAQALLRAEASIGDDDLCRRFTELIDPLRVPRRRARRGRHPRGAVGSRRASTPNGCRAVRTRPRTSSSAAAVSPTSSGPSSCCR